MATHVHKLCQALTVSLLAILTFRACAANTEDQTIYILSLLPYPNANPDYNPSWNEGPPIALALDMGQDQINNRTDLLPDYRIELIHEDCGCDFTTRAYVGFMRSAYSSPNKKIAGIIGPGCSSSSIALAPVSGHDGVSIVTVHGGGSPLLTRTADFPYSLGSLGSTEAFINVTFELMLKSNWTKIGALFDDSRVFYTSTVNKLFETLSDFIPDAEIRFLSPVYDAFIPLSVIRSQRLRINFLFTPVVTTQRILCLARHLGMVYPAFQWIVTSNTFDEVAQKVSFSFQDQDYVCSQRDMINIALNRTIFLNYRLAHRNESTPTTYSKLTFDEYDRLFKHKIDTYNLKNNDTDIAYTVWSTYFYDSLWAWAVVWDRLTKADPSLRPTEYEYGNETMSKVIVDEFYKLDFDGVSGRIKFFEDSGFVHRTVSVFQVIDRRPRLVAYYTEEEEFVKVDPLQHIPDEFENRIQSIGPVFVSIFIVIELVQGAVVIFLHILTIRFRTYHSVRASSPKLNQLTFIGCYVFIAAMLLYAISGLGSLDDTSNANVCNTVWPWLLPIAFTLTFGTVAARTWRLYRIFTHYLNPGPLIADYILALFVLILLVIDFVIATVWVAADPIVIIPTVHDVQEGSALFQIEQRHCSSKYYYISFGIVMSIRAVLLLAVLVLAILTRNIQNQSFTTKTLRILVYLFSIVFVFGFVLYYFFLFYLPLSPLNYISLLVTLNLMLLLFILLILLPPLVPLFREMFQKRFPSLKQKLTQIRTSEDQDLPQEGTSRFYI